MSKIVQVRSPCRLHFGLFSFGHAEGPQFGGVGMMIDPPAVAVTISPAAGFAVRGHLQGRTQRFVELLVRRWELERVPACEIEVQSPRNHTGLGVGTQLGLSVAAGLRRFLELPPLEVTDLAIAVDRGVRSSIGTLGFWKGGMILDAGKEPGEQFGSFMRQAISDSWRFVLCCDRAEEGMAGRRESNAFLRLPPVPDDVATQLRHIAFQEMARAAAGAECNSFGNALYRYGRLAGECFAPVQGGTYASPTIAERVELIRSWGISGVGQSSWGPTIFALTSCDEEAGRLVDRLRHHASTTDCEITVARPNNTGAQLSVN